MKAELTVSFVDFFPFIFAFRHLSFPILLTLVEMCQKKNIGRQLTINLDDEDDDIDFGSTDDIDFGLIRLQILDASRRST